jgi:hypothetical protein
MIFLGNNERLNHNKQITDVTQVKKDVLQSS